MKQNVVTGTLHPIKYCIEHETKGCHWDSPNVELLGCFICLSTRGSYLLSFKNHAVFYNSIHTYSIQKSESHFRKAYVISETAQQSKRKQKKTNHFCEIFHFSSLRLSEITVGDHCGRSQMLASYNDLLRKYPYRTNMLTTGLFFGLGDIIAQSLFPHTITTTKTDKDGKQVEVVEVSDYTPERTMRAMIYGSIFFAPISVLWHGKTLPKLKNPFISIVKRKMMETKSKKRLHLYDTVFRLGVDQLIFPGLVWIPLYNTVMVMLAQHEDPFGIIRNKLESNWWTVLRANWTVWPGFQLVNLYFIPVHLRIVCANVWSTGWNTFLSFVHNTKGHGKGSGKKLEELVDIEDDDQEIVMVYD